MDGMRIGVSSPNSELGLMDSNYLGNLFLFGLIQQRHILYIMEDKVYKPEKTKKLLTPPFTSQPKLPTTAISHAKTEQSKTTIALKKS